MNFKKVKAISTKDLKKDLKANLVFAMEQNIFLQENSKIIQYFYQLKSTLNFLVALLVLIRENVMLINTNMINTDIVATT